MKHPHLSAHPLVLSLLLLSLNVGCGEDGPDTPPPININADGGVVDGTVSTDAQLQRDAADEIDALPMDAEVDAMVVDAQIDAVIIDATPEPPTGPIPPPEGTDTSPEETDFDWNGVGSRQIGRSLPERALDWDEYPQYGVAQILPWSDSEECVCFDLDCATCSQENCSAQTCTYDLNDDHTLTKYHVELRSTTHEEHFITFEVNISAAPPIAYTDIGDVLARLERIPVEYWYGFKIITHFGRGIQFLHRSYFSGAAAYGSMNYIDTQTAQLPTLLHELGHTFEQYTRIGNPPALEPQSNILDPIWRNAIRSDNNRTSAYGNNNEWEDMAEFARLHAQCLVEGTLPRLQSNCPERFRIWERILLNGSTIEP